MAVPAYGTSGSGSSSTTGSLSPGYPASISAGDLLILHVAGTNTGTPGYSTPSGWTEITHSDATDFHVVYYKVADGTESGTLSVSLGSGFLSMARMYRFTGANTAEGAASAAHGSGTTVNMVSVTTTDVDRLAVHLTYLSPQTANAGAPVQASATGETGGNWTEAVAEYTTTTGRDGSLGLQTADMASAGTISGGSFNTNVGSTGKKLAFAIYQATTPASLVYQPAAPTIYRL